MRILVILVLILSFEFSQAQSFLNQTIFNLGEISKLNDDVIDLNLANTLEEDVFILRIEAPKHLDIKYSSKYLPSKKAALLRIKVNQKRLGKFSESINLYLSNNVKPIKISIQGIVQNIPKNNRQSCPSFKSQQVGIYELSTFQKQEESEIQTFFVEISDKKVSNPPSNESAETTRSIIAAQKKNVREPKTRKEPKINNRRNQPSLGQLLFGKQTDSVSIQDSVKIDHPQKEKIQIEQHPDSLLSDLYKPNNIVFLIDASTSMREEDKIELLKKSMIELLNPLRSIDFLSIVTYSGESTLILKPTSGINKEAIKEIINGIKADGSTQAVKGIKKAIQVAKSNFLLDGNNQIILASDGAFDIGERNESLRRKIKNEAIQGITISVLGIKNEKWTNKSLKEICELGQGSLIKINKESDTKKVLEEIKKSALN